jgi:hypothetical protein
MHPMMITALANEVERERQRNRARHEAFAVRSQDLNAAHGGGMLVRRLLGGISLRPRTS